ncbi:MAG TPA: septum formation protein Maf [Thermococcus paralvinellae]|uniref:dTTP/UTP pyrophosphatase n=1 Tax=Thermococcus paralvinellae TaxID=582419 RepID=A0A833E1S6_9EURY|nr:septum formation protein Maf [Thermococcus paralvinellae]HIP88882.1 septum formation protein Maf [Thermococcus paralvinellae]
MFVLASQSPRRREILGRFFENFKVVPSNADENVIAENPREKAIEVARRKAWEVYNKTGGTVVGADTIVVLENKVLGKPRDKEEAKEMLKLLSGKIHEVITGYCIIHKGEITGFEVTKVKFRELGEEEIDWYVRTGEPLDKAGAYAVQGKAAIFIEWIHGDFYNVMGLPVKVVLILRSLGFPLKQF